MEFSILYAIPRTPFLDSFFLALTKLVGSYGQLWLIIGIVLLLFKKTRKTGAAVIISFIAVVIVGQVVLKGLFARPRPCQIDQAFPLLVPRPSSTSFPSSHSGMSFGAAAAIFKNNKKAGIAALIFAALIAFSRLYLFLHFPTDVLTGMIVGIVMGILSAKLVDREMEKMKKKQGDRSGQLKTD